ncbi:MAG: PilZ domain protein [Sphingomonas bacterium]|uniref:PilZ domain-containing protein n=1 Tax=Sphingomonas bacterium TaxID=1895847 RepID=UPI002A643753|nr:PilZ domain protein [Sphingomonas bacterium]
MSAAVWNPSGESASQGFGINKLLRAACVVTRNFQRKRAFSYVSAETEMKLLSTAVTTGLEGQADSPATEQKDLRTSIRQRTLYRVACVRTDTDEGLARVRNLSDEGIMLRLSLPVLLGETIKIQFSETVSVEGLVVWTDGPDCGVKLTQPIDSSALLKDLAEQGLSKEGRALRLPVSTNAVVSSENGTRAVIVDDISQRGMKLQHDGSFSPGLRVKIRLQSGLQRHGVVRWSQDGIAGILLLEPFSPDELGSVNNL